jgi:hypothetical protein
MLWKTSQLNWWCKCWDSGTGLHINSIRLLSVGWFEGHCACWRTKNITGPEVQNLNCLCCYSTSNNVINMPLCCMLSKIHFMCWWTFWTFVSLRQPTQQWINICQLYFLRNRWIKCIYIFWDSVCACVCVCVCMRVCTHAYLVRFEVLTVVKIWIVVFWVVMKCHLARVHIL